MRVPASPTVKVTAHHPVDDDDWPRVHSTVLNASPCPSEAKTTDPDGVDGADEVSVTVAVQVVSPWGATDAGSQSMVVAVAATPAETAVVPDDWAWDWSPA